MLFSGMTGFLDRLTLKQIGAFLTFTDEKIISTNILPGFFPFNKINKKVWREFFIDVSKDFLTTLKR
jgi:hypothetical protein